MSDPILDFDISDNSGNRVYTWWIDNAYKIDEVIETWHLQANGDALHKHARNHALWRIFEERMRWKSLRNALQNTWPIKNFTKPDPVKPDPVNEPDPIIIQPIDGYTPPVFGGIRSTATDTSTREIPSITLPSQGFFHVPEYGADLCRVTHSAHSINYIGYAYWNNINAHRAHTSLRIVLSHNNELFVTTVDKVNLQILGIKMLGIHHTGEGVYFDKLNPDILYIPIASSLKRFNVVTDEMSDVFEVDGNVWQCHSSRNGKMHSCTVKDNNYNIRNWFVFNEFTGQRLVFSIHDTPDECQIDKSGTWLVIKEGNYVRYLNVITEVQRTLLDIEGAPGHSDNGWGCVIGEDDHYQAPSALVQWNFDSSVNRKLLYHTNYWNMGHFSFCNADERPLSEQRGIVSPSGDSLSRGREIVSVSLDGSGNCLIICPAFTENWNYENMPKANICPHGQFVCWTAIINGHREALIARIPNW